MLASASSAFNKPNKTIAIHQNDDWCRVKLPGFSDIPRKYFKVDVSLAEDEVAKHGYKALRGVAIMEGCQEKEARNMVEEENTEFLFDLDELVGTQDIHTPDDLLDRI